MCHVCVVRRMTWLVLLALFAAGCGDVTVSEQPVETAYDPSPNAAGALAPYPGPTPLLTPLPDPTDPSIDLQESAARDDRPKYPTFTPRPTPTPRPGPTATPYPIQPIPNDPAGSLLYFSHSGSLMSLSIDSQGRKIGEAVPIMPDLASSKPIFLGPASPNGRYVVLLESREPGALPYILDIETREMWPLFKNHPLQEQLRGWPYGWHPDNQQLLFWLFDSDELLLVNILTGQYTILALTTGSVQGASMSPDGQNVIYVGSNAEDYVLWRVSTAGTSAEAMPEPNGISYVFAWSPDGKHILYAGDKPLLLFDLDELEQRQLSGPFLYGYGYVANWSPNSQWIAYTGLDPEQTFGCAKPHPDWETCAFGGTAVYIENVDTNEVRRLSPGIMPVWSPDASMVAFLTHKDGIVEIWQAQTDGTDLRQLALDSRVGPIVWVADRR